MSVNVTLSSTVPYRWYLTSELEAAICLLSFGYLSYCPGFLRIYHTCAIVGVSKAKGRDVSSTAGWPAVLRFV